MAIELGVGYISILPETSKLTDGINRAFREAQRDAGRYGDRMGDAMGEAMDNGLKSGMTEGLKAGLRESDNYGRRMGDSLGDAIDNGVEDGVERGFRNADRRAKSAGKRMGSGIGGAVGGGLKTAFLGLGGLVAAVGVGQFFKDMYEGARESEKVTKRTANVIKTIGADSWTSAKAVGALSTAISNKTAVDDEQIQHGANLLLTFKNIRNEQGKGNKIFDRSVSLANDMSVAMGTDMKSSSILMGKALNDPIKGMSALTRVGVSFTEQQQEQITKMVESGNLLGAQKVIMRETESQFKGAGEAAATPFDKLKVTLGNLQEEMGLRLLPVIDKVATWIGQRLPAWLDAASAAWAKFTTGVQTVWSFLKDNKDVLIAMGSALVAARVALIAYNSYVRVTTAVTKAWTVVQKILNGTMKANIIGIVVTALALLVGAIVLAYKKSDTFRKIVDRAWAGIKKAISVAWNKVIKPALRAFWTFITKTLMPIVKRLYNNVIKPIFKAIGKAIAFAWNNVIKPLFRAWWFYISKVLFPIIRFLWSKVVKPVFGFIGRLIKAWWNGVVRPVFKAVWGFLKNTLFPIFRDLWNRVVKPVFNGIKQTISTVWNRGIKPVFRSLANFITETVPNAFKAGINAIGRFWENLKRLAATPVNFLIETVYNNGIRSLFNTVADKLGIDFRLPEIAKISVGRGFDNSATPGASRGSHPGLNARMATGGVLPGYTPGRDPHEFYSPTGGRLRLSGGEAVMRPEWTRVVGHKGVEDMNNVARKRGTRGVREMIGAFARGGVLQNPLRRVMWDGEPISAITAAQLRIADRVRNRRTHVIQGSWQQASGYSGTSHTGSGVIDTSPHGRGDQAVMRRVGFASWGRTPWGKGAGTGPHLHSVSLLDPGSRNNSQAQAFRAGQDGLGGSDYGPNPPMFPNLRGLLSQFNLGNITGGGGGTGGGSLFSRAAQRLIDWMSGQAKDLIGKIPGGDVGFGALAAGAGTKMVDSIAEWAKEKFAGTGGSAGGGSGLPANVKGLRNIISEVLRQLGQKNIVEAVMTRINNESGGNPGIVNNWDSNAAAGHPSVGLMQVIRGTYDAYKPRNDKGPYKYGVSVDPYSNIYAGVNYAHDRYVAGGGYSLRGIMLRPGGYAKGGVLPQIFDNGGILKPGALAYNASNKPEAVFNQAQFKAHTAAAVGAGSAGGGVAFPSRITLDVDGYQMDAYVRGIAEQEIEDSNNYNAQRGRMG